MDKRVLLFFYIKKPYIIKNMELYKPHLMKRKFTTMKVCHIIAGNSAPCCVNNLQTKPKATKKPGSDSNLTSLYTVIQSTQVEDNCVLEVWSVLFWFTWPQ